MELLSPDYAERMARKHFALRFLPSPSKWDLRRLRPGRLLDVGCGIGRQLGFVDGNGVGIDPNPDCVAMARSAGLDVVAPEDFRAEAGSFDSLLIAHVFEHISAKEGDDLLAKYVPFVRSGGQIILIAPQEKGYGSDPTHIRFVDLPEMKRTVESVGARVTRAYSFPLPRGAGKFYIGNEFRLIAQL